MTKNESVHSGKNLLSAPLDHRMKLYSTAAIAAGVSMLAFAPPADAEVVVTHKNIPIPISSYFGAQHQIPISLNNSGVKEFSFSLYSFAYHSFNMDLNVRPLEGGAIVASPAERGGSYASALMRGAPIGSSAHFGSQQVRLEDSHGIDYDSSIYSRHVYGNWNNVRNRYLGVKFLIGSEVHYGWVRLTVGTKPRRPMWATITEYAYETIPNKTIVAGAEGTDTATAPPSQDMSSAGPSLGMLALGFDGLALWRKDETLSTK